ncbi:CRAL-TRIO domain-containing protein [Tribonema minus]|uniref:CRAL-TRIO domain-containing protein n=1 Tax=Tribonema minus TaxID=303371 RepID=A0A835YIT9_9STRA|nr:CRAL-TRIO domain-containing protein [Tribonema minus]
MPRNELLNCILKQQCAAYDCPPCSCPTAAAGDLVLKWHEFLFCVLLSALVAGSTVAGGPFMRWLRDYWSEHSPALQSPGYTTVNLQGTQSQVVLSDMILSEPQPMFNIIKQHFPAFIYGRGRKGHVVVYEKVGSIHMKELAHQGVTLPMLLRHYVFSMEYLWRVVEPRGDAQLITIQDVQGIGLSDLTGMALEFAKGAAQTASKHYVERCYRTFIINSPAWFPLLWAAISPFVPLRTKKKASALDCPCGNCLSNHVATASIHVRVLGSNYRPVLQQEIEPDMIPLEYGGSCTTPLHESPEEANLSAMVTAINMEYYRQRSMERISEHLHPSQTISVRNSMTSDHGAGARHEAYWANAHAHAGYRHSSVNRLQPALCGVGASPGHDLRRTSDSGYIIGLVPEEESSSSNCSSDGGCDDYTGPNDSALASVLQEATAETTLTAATPCSAHHKRTTSSPLYSALQGSACESMST